MPEPFFCVEGVCTVWTVLATKKTNLTGGDTVCSEETRHYGGGFSSTEFGHAALAEARILFMLRCVSIDTLLVFV